MDYTQKKFEFLKTVEAPNLKKLLKLAVETRAEKEDCTYEMLTKKNANRTGQVPFEDVEKLCELLYNTWYHNTLSAPQNQLSHEVQTYVEKLRTSPHLHPDAVRKQGFYNFIESDKLREEFGNTSRMRFAHNQYHEGFISRDVTQKSLPTDFLYIDPRVLFGRKQGSERTQVDCRLYLNLKAPNICKVAHEIILQSKAKKLSIEFKIAGNDNRNDTLVIYTNYHTAPRIVSVLNEIKNNSPELFDGCEKMGPALGKIDGFIGFGEESTFAKTSYNLQRAEAINDMASKIKNQTIRSILFDDQPLILTSQNEKLSRFDYLKYLIKTRVTEQTKADIDFLKEENSQQIETLVDTLQSCLLSGKEFKPQAIFEDKKGKNISFSDLFFSYEDKLANVFDVSEDDKIKRNFYINQNLYSSSSLGKNVSAEGREQNVDVFLFNLFEEVILEKLARPSAYSQDGLNHQNFFSRRTALKKLENKTFEGEMIVKNAIFWYKMHKMNEENCLPMVAYPAKPTHSQTQQNYVEKKEDIKEFLNFNFDAALLNAVPSKREEMVQKMTNMKLAERFFKKYDLSCKNFALNYSTEREFEQFKHDEFMEKISQTPSFF